MNWIKTLSKELIRADRLVAIDLINGQDLRSTSPLKQLGGRRDESLVLQVEGVFEATVGDLWRRPLGHGYKSYEDAHEAIDALLRACVASGTGIYSMRGPSR